MHDVKREEEERKELSKCDVEYYLILRRKDIFGNL